MGIIKRFTSEDYVNSKIQTELEKIDLSTIEPKESDIPKVFIDGIIPTTKDDVLAELTYISKTLQFHSYITIKCSNVGGTGCFAKGLLNDCKIYNYAISDTEMNEWLTASTYSL